MVCGCQAILLNEDVMWWKKNRNSIFHKVVQRKYLDEMENMSIKFIQDNRYQILFF